MKFFFNGVAISNGGPGAKPSGTFKEDGARLHACYPWILHRALVNVPFLSLHKQTTRLVNHWSRGSNLFGMASVKSAFEVGDTINLNHPTLNSIYRQEVFYGQAN
jgi:hypothetical protein